MKYRYLYFSAAIIFLAVGVVEFFHAQNMTAGAVNSITGAIFLFLGISPPGQRKG
jgi:hypothetical protein